MAHDVFISHSSRDKQTADAVCAVLESKSIRCWVAPRDILPGADWGESIINGIRECRVMVLIFSQNANNSVQIKREVERAIHHGVTIIPLRIEDILPTGALEYSISSAHWLDAFNPPMEQHLDYLADTVQAILQGKPSPPAPAPVPVGRPHWMNLAIAGGAIAAALLLYLLFVLLFPTSLKGDWNLTDCQLTLQHGSAVSDLLANALSSNLQGQLVVKSLNAYTFTMSGNDQGTVAVAADQSAGGVSASALTFTSDKTHKSTIITFMDFDPGSNGSMYGFQPGEKGLLFGVNAGGGEVILHGTASSNSGGSLPANAVGTWQGTPFDLNPPDNLWSGTLVIDAGGRYTLTVMHNESGLVTAASGNWSAVPSGTPVINGMPLPTMYGGILQNGHYSFSGSGTLNIATGSGTMTFKRGW